MTSTNATQELGKYLSDALTKAVDQNLPGKKFKFDRDSKALVKKDKSAVNLTELDSKKPGVMV